MNNWHNEDGASVLKSLGVTAGGLSSQEAQARLKQYGPNRLTQKKGQSPWVRFLLQMHQPLVYILNGAALISFLLGEYVDAGVIFAVVIVNAIVGFLQEAKALNAIEALSRVMISETDVCRDGQRQRRSSEELVPGDLVFLTAGDKVSADMRLLQTRGLKIEEAALTGESEASNKESESLSVETPLADRANMAYAGTLVTAGEGQGVVIATANDTELGRISQLIESEEVLDTPLTQKMAQFSMFLLYAIMGLAGVTFVVGLLRGETWFDMFMAAVALAVGAIPEGLPAAMTITLAIGVSRMAKRQAIIRKLPAVETLGSTTIICSDKTGTLTANQMTVRQLFCAGRQWQISGVGYQPEGVFEGPGSFQDDQALMAMLRAGVLCNDSRLFKGEQDWEIQGDPTEAALLVVAKKAGIDSETLRNQQPRQDGIPFSSENRFMASLHGETSQSVLYVKGAADRLLDVCVSALDDQGKVIQLDTNRIQEQMGSLADQGLRVLLVAQKAWPAGLSLSDDHATTDLCFLGLFAMSDPPRAEAIAAVKACQQAGIAVKMITGDHARTAAAIAREVGIFQPGQNALTGVELAGLDETALNEAVATTHVFARVAPEQKLRLVKALQKDGHVVAMTGDGVNDAPALRRSDIGVAMGRGGTEVAREAADMVLTDDNFATIEAAVEEGRGVFDNLIKFITWTLPTNIGMGLVILAAVFAGMALPILPVQILWINMTTVVLLGLTLSFEPLEDQIMTRQPRDPSQPILDRPLVTRILLVGVLLLIGSFGAFQWALDQGRSETVGRTLAANVFVFGELFYLFNCRSLTQSSFKIGFFSNPLLIWGCLLMTVLQLAYTYMPLMQGLFQTTAIGWLDWVIIIGWGLIMFVIVGIEKAFLTSPK